MAKVGIIIQARTSSTRLPAKVLKELPHGSGVTVLEQVIRRAKACGQAGEIIVATTRHREDEPIVDIAGKEGVGCFRGSKEDVLARYFFAAQNYKIDTVVRITSDCPCVEPFVADGMIQEHLKNKWDYTTNTLTRTFPRGLDVEVISFSALEAAHKAASEGFEREHVTPYIYMTAPQRFRIKEIKAPGKLNRPEVRLTIDTEEDYCLLCCVYDNLYNSSAMFHIEQVLELFDKRPCLGLMNKNIAQKEIRSEGCPHEKN